jgi:hypothetical protein
LSQYKKVSPKSFLDTVCRRHHFANPNTTEIIVSLLFISLISRLLAFLSRNGTY